MSWISPDGCWTDEEIKTFGCIARLSSNEITILLPLIERHIGSDDRPDEEQISDPSATLTEYDNFGHQLVIIEGVTKCLIVDGKNGQENTLIQSMGSDKLVNLLENLKEIMTRLCEYLEGVHKHWESFSSRPNDSPEFNSALGTLRLVSLWLCEDLNTFESQCKRFLIDLMIKVILCKVGNLADCLVTAIHAIHIQNENLKDVIQSHPNVEQALETYLEFVKQQYTKSENLGGPNAKHGEKRFKLRCGLVKDLMSKQ